jgi:hypothetical protein
VTRYLFFLLALAGWTGSAWPSAAFGQTPASGPVAGRAGDRVAVVQVVRRAEGFLRSLAPEMDPVRLRSEHRMKGKKFYVEYLNGWYDIYQLSGGQDRKRIREFLAPVVARTDTDAYHDMFTCPDREEIDRIVPRILAPAHMNTRGINNTMGIVYRLRQLGHAGGPMFCDLWRRPGCITRTHPDLTTLNLDNLLTRQPVYDMTHEVFYLTEFGDTPFQCGSDEDLKYIRRMHVQLIPIFIGKKDIDAVAELVMDLNYLHLTDLPEYRAGYEYLLGHQNPDGSYGDPKHIAEIVNGILYVNPVYLPEVGQYLHTTEVTLNALCAPFWLRAGQPATRPKG